MPNINSDGSAVTRFVDKFVRVSTRIYLFCAAVSLLGLYMAEYSVRDIGLALVVLSVFFVAMLFKLDLIRDVIQRRYM